MIHSTVTLRDQPAEPSLLLERNVRMYAGLVQKIMPRLTPMEPTELAKSITAIAGDERAAWDWLSKAHLLAISLRQIEEHLKRLRGKRPGFRTSKIAQAAEQFFRAYKTADVRNLRHLLEHQAEYLAGGGKKRHLIVDVTESVSFGNDASGEIWVSIFGKRCRVDPIMRAAAALEVALREGGQLLQEDGDAPRAVTFTLISGPPPLTVAFTEEYARLMLEWLLAHEEKSVVRETLLNLLREAMIARGLCLPDTVDPRGVKK